MTKHTPGPWEAHIIPGFKHSSVTNSNPRDPSIDIKTANHAADASLIAAAPDLLAALNALYKACEWRANQEGGDFGPDIGPAAEMADAAIAKATGAK